MTDGIIKGAGNSRYLRTVPNAMTLYPTHEAMMEALVSGTFPIDLNGINPAGWNQVGMKLDKANLLTDALCTALGLATTATPTQAMEKLRQLVNTAQTGVNNGVKLALGQYAGTGKYGSADKNILTFSFKPKAVFIPSVYGYTATFIYPNQRVNVGTMSSTYIAYTQWDDLSVSWYSANANTQLNTTDMYYYIAFG